MHAAIHSIVSIRSRNAAASAQKMPRSSNYANTDFSMRYVPAQLTRELAIERSSAFSASTDDFFT
jgi:hypothetical protein